MTAAVCFLEAGVSVAARSTAYLRFIPSEIRRLASALIFRLFLGDDAAVAVAVSSARAAAGAEPNSRLISAISSSNLARSAWRPFKAISSSLSLVAMNFSPKVLRLGF